MKVFIIIFLFLGLGYFSNPVAEEGWQKLLRETEAKYEKERIQREAKAAEIFKTAQQLHELRVADNNREDEKKGWAKFRETFDDRFIVVLIMYGFAAGFPLLVTIAIITFVSTLKKGTEIASDTFKKMSTEEKSKESGLSLYGARMRGK